MNTTDSKANDLAICPICNEHFQKIGRKTFCSNKCRQRNFYHAFNKRTSVRYKLRLKLLPKIQGRYKYGSRTKLVGGVLRYDRYFIAHICVDGEIRTKRYSIAKLGELGAKLAATFQRAAWVVELGLWNPKDGDPFSILTLPQPAPDEISSPWIHERYS